MPLALAAWFVFTATGGNKDFITFDRAFESVSLFTFAMSDPTTFTNMRIGQGRYYQIIKLVFWLLVL